MVGSYVDLATRNNTCLDSLSKCSCNSPWATNKNRSFFISTGSILFRTRVPLIINLRAFGYVLIAVTNDFKVFLPSILWVPKTNILRRTLFVPSSLILKKIWSYLQTGHWPQGGARSCNISGFPNNTSIWIHMHISEARILAIISKLQTWHCRYSLLIVDSSGSIVRWNKHKRFSSEKQRM